MGARWRDARAPSLRCVLGASSSSLVRRLSSSSFGTVAAARPARRRGCSFIAAALDRDPPRRASRRRRCTGASLRGTARRHERCRRAIARGALASRVAVLVVGYFAVVTIGIDRRRRRASSSRPTPLFNLPAASTPAGTAASRSTATPSRGASITQQNIAFFPGVPDADARRRLSARRASRRACRGNAAWRGCCGAASSFRCSPSRGPRSICGASRATRSASDRAGAAVALLAAYPFAVFFSAPYTESLFLLGAVAAIYHFRRGELVPAAAWGLLVGLTRPNGCFLSVVLALLIGRAASVRSDDFQIFRRPRFPNPSPAAAAPGIGMLIYSAYVHHLTGAWFGWARLHEAWGRSYSGLAPVERAYGWITDEGLLHVVEGRALRHAQQPRADLRAADAVAGAAAARARRTRPSCWSTSCRRCSPAACCRWDG